MRFTVVVYTFLIAFSASAQVSPRTATPRANIVVVQFAPGAAPAAGVLKTGSAAFDRIAERLQVHQMERATPFLDRLASTPATEKGLDALRRTYYVRYRSGEDPYEAAAQLGFSSDVVYAEPLFIHHLAEKRVDPDDAQFGEQTHLRQMRLPQAWDIVKGEDGNPKVVVAIVDSGTDWRHEDLRDNIWTNPGEVANNGIDDDQNGFIDDVHGANFANEDPAANDPAGDPSLPESGTHGTATASAAGAVTNNGIGIAGSSWNATIMPVHVGCKDNAWGICWGYDGVLYAAMNGADIINTSWGDEGLTAFERDALELATNLGSLVVTAAGNFQTDIMESIYNPAGFPRALTVGGTEKDTRVIASFSNYGMPVDVYAPAVGINIGIPGDGYFEADGTSFSAPLAAGVAALVKSRFPDLTPDQLREQIRTTSTRIEADNPAYPGPIGGGYVNAEAAVSSIDHPALRVKRWSWADSDSDGTIQPGETVSLTIVFENHLADATDLEIGLHELRTQHLAFSPSSHSVGALAGGDSVTVGFSISVASDVPANELVFITTQIRDGSFADSPDFVFLNLNNDLQELENSLNSFYTATEGTYWDRQDNWNTPISSMEDFATWYGVFVKRGQLTGLELESNNLRGTLPGSVMTKLRSLESLDLWSNNIEGEIPRELAQLSRLKKLVLSANNLSGSIPSGLGQLSKLTQLRISSNNLSGALPPELGQLRRLELADFSSNSLTGPVPAELGQLEAIQYLDLSNNSLSGSLPAELGDMQNLSGLRVNDNDLSGQLPHTLTSIEFIEFLDFSGQDLCAPPDSDFQAWLSAIPSWSGSYCTGIWFRGSVEIQTFELGVAVTSQPLPSADGGQSPYTYALSPALPAGLTFDATSRTISGTPTTVSGQTSYVYTATDASGATGTMTISIEVSAPVGTDQDVWPEVLTLIGNYPNPFRGVTNITFDLPRPSMVSVVVIDLLGRSVRSVPDQHIGAGYDRKIRLDLSGLAAGLYFYRMQTRSDKGLEVGSGSLVVQ